jgi:hypothetical protein
MTKEELEKQTMEWKNNYILKLEKENAELKEKLKPENCLKLLAKEGYIKFTSEQLTKAKTYLKYFIEILKRFGANKEPLVAEAEQFLNSEVEK